MIITCGASHTDSRIEAIFTARREEGGFETSAGCGLNFDLSNSLSQALMYRCVECARWLCKPCILAHFAATGDDKRASA